mgnify:CR=1 FL=1
MKLDSAIFEELLNKGRLNIFLDGLNEIEKNIKVSVFSQINNLLEEYPGMVLELSSHTDSRGSNERNQKLSEKRANKVQELLVASGIDASRLTARGAGEDASVDKKSAAARQLVRRVTLKLK